MHLIRGKRDLSNYLAGGVVGGIFSGAFTGWVSFYSASTGAEAGGANMPTSGLNLRVSTLLKHVVGMTLISGVYGTLACRILDKEDTDGEFDRRLNERIFSKGSKK